jgi:hypothetical protein
LDITYKVIQNTNDIPFYDLPTNPKYKEVLKNFPSTTPVPPPNDFNQVSKPIVPAIDIKPIGVVNPLNSPTRQLFKANLAASNVEGDLTQTANAEKYLADTANKTPAGVNLTTPLLPNTAITSNASNSTIPSIPQNFGKQPEYDPSTGDYKKNIFGQVKLFKVRGVDANQN